MLLSFLRRPRPPGFAHLEKHNFRLCMAFQHVSVSLSFYYSCKCVYVWGFFPGRISPSDGDSVVSDHSSEREATEENQRAHATPSDSKQTRKLPINVLNGKWPWQRSTTSLLLQNTQGVIMSGGEWEEVEAEAIGQI